MLDEKTTLKLKDVAKKLGKDWIVDLINSKERNIIFKRGRDLEINLYKKWGTKFKYSIYPRVLYNGYPCNFIMIKSYSETQLNLSVKNIADKILSAIPADINEIIQKEHAEMRRKQQEALTHEYFIHSLAKMGEMKHCSKSDDYQDCSISLNGRDVRLGHLYCENLYNFSVKINREMIIKLLKVLNE